MTNDSGSRNSTCWRQRWATGLLTLVSLLVACALAEAVLRSLDIGDPRVPTYFRRPHPVLGWALEPGAEYRNPLPEETVTVRFNQAGWRDREHTLDKHSGVFRIVVLGDSFMEAYSVDFAQSVPHLLEQSLTTPARTVEVINLGVAGYGTLQEYLAFRHYGRLYDPDLVLLAFTVGNDLRNNSRQLESLLGTDKFKLLSRPFLASAEGPWSIDPIEIDSIETKYRQAVRDRDRIWLKIYDRSSLLQLLRKAATTMIRSTHADPESFELAVSGVHYCQETPEYSEAWQVTRRILRRLQDEVAAQGGQLAVFSVPLRREASRPDMEEAEASSPRPERLCLEDAAGFARLGSTLDELGVPYFDLLPEFRLRSEGTRLYRRSDRHWNARGHALAADLVSTEIQRRDLAPTASSPTDLP